MAQHRQFASRVSRVTRWPIVAAAAAKGAKAPAGKGFGAPPKKQQQKPADGCPCGSGKTYKDCCKPHHLGTAQAPSVLDTVRARFAAIQKKDVSYLLSTTAPAFHSFHYGGEPGASLRQLEDDLHNTVDHYTYSNLRIREVRPSADSPDDEATVVFQYTLFDKRTPALTEQGKPARKVQIEESRFMRDPETGLWQFTDYRLVEVPEALAATAEMQAQDMAAAQGLAAAQGSSSSGGDGGSSGGDAAAAAPS